MKIYGPSKLTGAKRKAEKRPQPRRPRGRQCDHLPIPTVSTATGAQCALCGWLYPLGPSNDADVTKLYRQPMFDYDGFDWDPSRPLREQWPWCGGTHADYLVTQRPTQKLPAVEPWPDADLDDEIRAGAPACDHPVTASDGINKECATCGASWCVGDEHLDLLAPIHPLTEAELAQPECPAETAAAIERIAEAVEGES